MRGGGECNESSQNSSKYLVFMVFIYIMDCNFDITKT